MIKMTSPGLKRPLDFELTSQTSQTASEGTTPNNSSISSSHGASNRPSPENGDETNANGTKRRCTDTNFQTKPINLEGTNIQDKPESMDSCMQLNHQRPQNHMISPSPPFRDASTSYLDDELKKLLRNELHSSQIDLSGHFSNGDEPLILTTRQLRSICAKLISAREKSLREEFDRRLASKLAEQYDLFAKANYLNTFAEPSRTPTPLTTVQASTTAAAANHTSLTNAIAAALMQRSTPNPILSPASSPNSIPSAATSMPNLTTIAASLTANGHHGAIPSTHHLAAYNLQQHQAAAAAATAMRLAHHQQQQQQQQQQRISMPVVPANGLIPTGPVLLASNLDDQLATPEALFTLFGVFGDVIRVKILYNKKDNALIQMADASRAQVAQSYLDKQRIFGKVIRVTRSKHQLVQMPRDGGQSDAGLTKDFTNSPLHRFKIPGSRNYLNIYPPSNTLHVSNIPSTVDESDLHKAFTGQCGFEFTSFKFFPKDRKMALMKFNTVEQATIALVKMHNYQISDENNLRVSFSKSAL